jgi:hypothetical protein
MGLIGLLFFWRPWGLILQAIAVFHFVRRRPGGYWLWIILIGGGLGAVAYIVAEVIPDAALLRGTFAGFTRRRRIGELEGLIQVNPAIGNREELADLYLEEQKYAEARRLYDQVIQAQPNEIDPYYRRGLTELAMADALAALGDLERVVSRDPKYDFHRAMGLLGQARSVAGDPQKADQAFQAAIAMSTLSETYFNYASFLASQHRAAEAREFAQRILDKKPTMPRYLRRRERPWFRKAQALLKRLPAQ